MAIVANFLAVGPFGSVRLESLDRSGGDGWRVTIAKPGSAARTRPFADQAQAVTFAGQVAALHGLPLLDLRGEIDQ